MKKIITIIICFFSVFPITALSQSDCSEKNLYKFKSKIIANDFDTSDTSILIKTKMEFQITNISNKNLIFWNRVLLSSPDDGKIVKLILSRNENFKMDEIIKTYNWYPSNIYAKEWDDLRATLDVDSPIKEKTLILKPNESLVFSYILSFNMSKKQLLPLKLTYYEKENHSFKVWIKLQYASWSPNIEPKGEHRAINLVFGKMLQKRWKSFGHLMLESLDSEPIPLDLGSAVMKAAEK